MLKGKVKIQLFNAESGTEEKVIESENMVTNAINYLLNPPMGAMAAGLKYSDMLGQILPLCTLGLGGLLLWDGEIPENPETVIPPIDIGCTGHAGGTYTGTAERRGTYNTAESGEIENGYRHVWDFGTDKANGTVKCLSLTSQQGGNAGYGTYESSEKSVYNWGTVVSSGASTSPRYVGKIDDNTDVFAYTTSNSTMTVYLSKHTDMSNIGMFDTVGLSSDTESFTVTLSSTASSHTVTHSLIDGKLHTVLSSLTSNKLILRHVITNLSMREKENEDTVTVTGAPSIASRAFAQYFDGNYYVPVKETSSSPVEILKISDTGEFIENIIPDNTEWTSFSSSSFFGGFFTEKRMIFERYMIENDKASYHNFFGNGSTITGIVPSGNPCYKYFSYGSGKQICAFLGYLATINNLPEPVTKTNEQTMKITYEIVQTDGKEV